MPLLPSPSGDLDVEIYAGQSIDYTLTLTRRDNGQPVDLTGVSLIDWQFRRSPEGASIELQMSTANGRAAVEGDPTNGQIRVTAPASATAAIQTKEGTQDLFVTFASGTVVPYVSGRYRLLPRTTK